MNKLLIRSKIVSDDLASFQWNFDLNTENKKFNTVEEANDLPLAKEMFYLPFIKSVSVSKNEMVLERFDIVSCEDILDEVEKIIEKKLKLIFSDKFQMDGKIQNIVTLYTESTPNPKVMKFVCNKLLTKKIHEVKRVNSNNESKFINFHPLINTFTITIETTSFIDFMIENNKKIHIFSSAEGKVLKVYEK